MRDRWRLRPVLIALHRYGGLGIAAFVFIAGLTGAVLAYKAEIDGWLNPPLPGLMGAEPRLDPFELRRRIERAYPLAWASSVELKPLEPGRPATVYLDPKAAQDAAALPEWVEVHPVSGAVLGEYRRQGEINFSRRQLMATLVDLHYRLWLPEEAGRLIMGVAAMVWFLDHLWGLLLAFPNLRDWRKSFLMRWRGGGYKRWFDLHRAGAVWLWALLLSVACTSFAYNLPEVFEPMVAVFAPTSAPVSPGEALTVPMGLPPVSFEQAHELLRREIDRQAAAQGFSVRFLQYLALDRQRGVYRLQLATTQDIRRDYGRTVVFLSASTGAVLGWQQPQGGTAGDDFIALQAPLHVGDLVDVPHGLHQLLLCLAGIATAVLSVTGVYLWWKKRRARQAAAARRA